MTPAPQAAATPFPRDTRQDRIDRIHALARWLEDNPDAPMPTMVSATYTVNQKDEVDEATRVAGIMSIADHLGIEAYEGVNVVQAERYLSSQHANGITIIYRVNAMKDRLPEKRYLT